MSSERAPAEAPAPSRCKIRLRFGKGFDLRLLSHHDLLRAFERLLRRADVPVAYSRGFIPHPKIVFALSLPLGVVGRAEVVELELAHELSLEELRRRILSKAPPGLTLHDLKRVELKATAQVARLCYRLAVPHDRVAALRQALPGLLARPSCVVARDRTGRHVDLRPSIFDLRLVENAEAGSPAGAVCPTGSFALELELRPAPAGTARPEEIFSLLGQPDLLEVGGVLERTRLVLADEFPAQPTEGPTWPKLC